MVIGIKQRVHDKLAIVARQPIANLARSFLGRPIDDSQHLARQLGQLRRIRLRVTSQSLELIGVVNCPLPKVGVSQVLPNRGLRARQGVNRGIVQPALAEELDTRNHRLFKVLQRRAVIRAVHQMIPQGVSHRIRLDTWPKLGPDRLKRIDHVLGDLAGDSAPHFRWPGQGVGIRLKDGHARLGVHHVPPAHQRDVTKAVKRNVLPRNRHRRHGQVAAQGINALQGVRIQVVQRHQVLRGRPLGQSVQARVLIVRPNLVQIRRFANPLPRRPLGIGLHQGEIVVGLGGRHVHLADRQRPNILPRRRPARGRRGRVPVGRPRLGLGQRVRGARHPLPLVVPHHKLAAHVIAHYLKARGLRGGGQGRVQLRLRLHCAGQVLGQRRLCGGIRLARLHNVVGFGNQIQFGLRAQRHRRLSGKGFARRHIHQRLRNAAHPAQDTRRAALGRRFPHAARAQHLGRRRQRGAGRGGCRRRGSAIQYRLRLFGRQGRNLFLAVPALAQLLRAPLAQRAGRGHAGILQIRAPQQTLPEVLQRLRRGNLINRPDRLVQFARHLGRVILPGLAVQHAKVVGVIGVDCAAFLARKARLIRRRQQAARAHHVLVRAGGRWGHGLLHGQGRIQIVNEGCHLGLMLLPALEAAFVTHRPVILNHPVVKSLPCFRPVARALVADTLAELAHQPPVGIQKLPLHLGQLLKLAPGLRAVGFAKLGRHHVIGALLQGSRIHPHRVIPGL